MGTREKPRGQQVRGQEEVEEGGERHESGVSGTLPTAWDMGLMGAWYPGSEVGASGL